MSSSAPLIGSVIKPVTSEFDASLTCPECHSVEVIEDRRAGTHVCTDCGLQIGGQLISEENEWRDFDDDGPRAHGTVASRVGGIEGGLIDMGLSTVMAANADGLGAHLSRLQSKSTSIVDTKLLMEAFSRVNRLASSLSLSSGVIDRTNHLYKRVMESGAFRSKKGDVVLVACLYIACRSEGVPRTLKEICQSASSINQSKKNKDIAVKDVARAFKKIKQSKAYQTTSQSQSSSQSMSQPDSAAVAVGNSSGATALSLVPRYCSTLKCSQFVEQLVEALIEGCEKQGCLEGKAPSTIAAACIMLATQTAAIVKNDQSINRPIERIATVSLTAVGTIKKAYKDIYQRRAELVPSSFASQAQLTQVPSP